MATLDEDVSYDDFLDGSVPLRTIGYHPDGRVGLTKIGLAEIEIPEGCDQVAFTGCEFERFRKLGIPRDRWFKDQELDDVYRKQYTVKAIGGELRFEDNKGERVVLRLELFGDRVYFRVLNGGDPNGFIDFSPQIASFGIRFGIRFGSTRR